MLRDEAFCTPKIEGMITEMVNKDIFIALSKKLNVIIDATNVKIKYLNEFINTFKYHADIDYQIFDISLNKAIERDENREEKVGSDVIKRMYKDYKILIDSFDFQPVEKQTKPLFLPKYNTNPKTPDAVIFDIDGTIALKGNRDHFDWKKVDVDYVNHIVSEQINHHKQKDRVIILVSGRDMDARELTISWLDFYEIPYDFLYMREHDDNRKDIIVKKEIYDKHVKDKYNVLAVYDDRLQVLDMWEKLGLFTFNVNQGNIPF